MTLVDKQILFMSLIPSLIVFMISKGYNPIMGYGFRSKETQKMLYDKGASKTLNSNHLRCLAIDVELRDANKKYITNDEGHKIFGPYWESLHPLCRWGGRFGDYNHYSILHDNVI